MTVSCLAGAYAADQLKQTWAERMEKLLNLGKHEIVLEEADAMVRKNPGDASALMYRARAGANDKRLLDQALTDINKAISLAPSRQDFFMWRAMVYTNMDESEAALQDLRVAVRNRPHDAYLRDRIAVNLLHLNRAQEALAACDLSLRISPEEYNFTHTRARILRRLGRIEEAQSELDKVLRANPKDQGALIDKATYAISQKNWQEAVRTNSRILEIADPHLRGVVKVALIRRADASFALKDYKAALKDYRQAAKAYPYDRALRAALAKSYEAVGDKDNARREYDFVKELDEEYQPPR